MEKLTYKISSRAAILLGRENVSKVDGALIELIKNCYDADASKCYVYFDEDAIYIIDDGVGMDKASIINNWLTIGTDNKRNNYVSKKHRIKSGEKGIGRLALDRLGERYDLYTKAGSNVIHISTDWNDFEKGDKNLNDIEVFYEEIQTDLSKIIDDKFIDDIELGSFKTGTIIKITKLRDSWTESIFNKISRMLGYLLPPVEQSNFKLFFKDFYHNKKIKIYNNISAEYDYKIEAKFDGEKFDITLFRNEFDINIIPDYMFGCEEFSFYPFKKEDFLKKEFKYAYSISELLNTDDSSYIAKAKNVGAFEFKYIFMKLQVGTGDIEKFYYKNISKSRELWMQENSGIKIYRDDFIIRPYGDNKSNDSYDWLGLDARKAKSPAAISHPGMGWKVRNSQGQGTLFISRINNGYILDKSSREGIIENDEFNILKEMLVAIISVFEKDRAYIGKSFKKISDVRNKKDKIKKDSHEIADKLLNSKFEEPISLQDSEVLAEAVSYYKEEREELISELKLLRSLSTNGLITSAIVHDLKTLDANLIKRIDNLQFVIERKDDELIHRHISSLKLSDTFLKSWISMLLNQTKNDRRKRRKCSICDVLRNSVELIKPILDIKGINISLSADYPDLRQKIFITDFESIIYNLVINSVESFERNPVDVREIAITLLSDNNSEFSIIYSDSGKGIGKLFKNPYDIFNFGTTAKVDQNGDKYGSGLGMYIVSSTMREYNGDYVLLKYDNGFELKLTFPIKEI